MLKIYFDDVLIDEDSYTALTNDYKLFTDSFKLGSVACNSFKLSVNKAMVENHPNEVKIEDDNTTFYLVVDSITEDRYVYNYTLVDKLINFNFNYDAKPLIDSKKENEETCYLSDIWHDMCSQAGVEYDDEYEFINDIEVEWYDNTIQARKYLSYIAELQGGYACILENGKQSFKPYKKSSSKTIDLDECSDFILGEKKTITRVVYDTGTTFWSFGDDTGTTLYLDTDNVFITNEETVENIYDLIVDFEFYLVKVPNAPMDSSVRAGDIITFTDGDNEYPTIAQYSMSFGGAWTGGYELEVKTDKQEETKITGMEAKILKISTEINRANAELTIVAEKTESTSQSISTLEQTVDGFTETVQKVDDLEDRTTTIETTIDGIDVKLSQQGGSNLLINPVGLFGNYGWTGICKEYTDTDIKNNTFGKSALFLQNGTRSQIVQVPNGTYTVSFLSKKLIELANCTIDINGYVIALDSAEWSKKTHTFEVKSNKIEIKLISDTNDSCYVSDLMLNSGLIAQSYSSNATEVVTNNVKIGDGIEISSNASNIKQKVDNDGNRIINTNTNQIVSEFTDKGMTTDEITAKKGQIAGELIARHGNQVWHSVV